MELHNHGLVLNIVWYGTIQNNFIIIIIIIFDVCRGFPRLGAYLFSGDLFLHLDFLASPPLITSTQRQHFPTRFSHQIHIHTLIRLEYQNGVEKLFKWGTSPTSPRPRSDLSESKNNNNRIHHRGSWKNNTIPPTTNQQHKNKSDLQREHCYLRYLSP